MRIRTSLLAVVLLATASLAEESNWGNEWAPMEDAMPSRRSVDTKPAEQADIQGRYLVHESIQSNSTTQIDEVIEQLINSRREGRNLGNTMPSMLMAISIRLCSRETICRPAILSGISCVDWD